MSCLYQALTLSHAKLLRPMLQCTLSMMITIGVLLDDETHFTDFTTGRRK